MVKDKSSGLSNNGGGGSGGGGEGAGGDSITSNGVVIEREERVARQNPETEMLAAVNPKYGQPGPDGDIRAYTHNCQRCVFAYEMRMRGYDVEATERLFGNDLVAYGWQNAFEGMVYESVGATRKSNIERNVERKLREFGNGSRAIVYCAWDSGSAHVFNVGLDENGVMWARDAQTGRTHMLSDYALRMRPSMVKIARVDNLEPSQLYLNGAIKKKSS